MMKLFKCILYFGLCAVKTSQSMVFDCNNETAANRLKDAITLCECISPEPMKPFVLLAIASDVHIAKRKIEETERETKEYEIQTVCKLARKVGLRYRRIQQKGWPRSAVRTRFYSSIQAYREYHKDVHS